MDPTPCIGKPWWNQRRKWWESESEAYFPVAPLVKKTPESQNLLVGPPSSVSPEFQSYIGKHPKLDSGLRYSSDHRSIHRDNDELRFSIRSAMTSLSIHIGKLHLVAGDFPIPHEVTNEYPSLPEFLKDSLRQYRLGQIPQWLMPAKVSHGVLEEDWDDHKAGISLKIHHHGQFFEDYKGSVFDR